MGAECGDLQQDTVIAAGGDFCCHSARGPDGGAVQGGGAAGEVQQLFGPGLFGSFQDRGCFLLIHGGVDHGLTVHNDQAARRDRHRLQSGEISGCGGHRDLSRSRLMEFVVQPHQDDRHLLPGGGPVRREGVRRGAAHQSQIIGHGDIAGIGSHVPEGHGQILGQAGDGAVAHGPHQHHRQFLPGDGVVGAEVLPLVGEGHMAVSGLHSAGIPGVRGDILIDGFGRGSGLPAEETAQDHREGGPGHLLAQAEPGSGLALKEPQLHTAPDALPRPVVGRHIGKARRGGHRQTPGQHGAQGQAAQQPFQLLFHHSFAPLGTFRCQIVFTIPEFSAAVKPNLSKPAETIQKFQNSFFT